MLYPTIVLSTLLATVAGQSCTTSYCSPDALDGCNLSGVGAASADVYDDCDDVSYDWTDINDDGYQGDKKFMDGNGPLNDGLESDIPRQQIAGSIYRFQENVVKRARLNWPEYEELLPYVYRELESGEVLDYGRPYMSNFNLTDGSCELNAAMCCFTATRDGSQLEDNAEVCSHDLGDSAPSSHVANGIGFFDDGNDETYCVATTWSDDEADPTNVYKGNLIFDISYGTFLEKAYVKGITGAPMCGCIEQMPTVKPTDQIACRTVATGNNAPGFQFSKDGSETEVDIVAGDLTFSDCGDFVSHFESVHGSDMKEELEKHIVDSCDDATETMLNEKAWIPGSDPVLEYTVNEDDWTLVAGTADHYKYIKNYDLDDRDAEFRELINNSPTGIIRRYCDTCLGSHRDIYYKRITEIPDDINFLDLLLNNWKEQNNVLGVDFTLHSTYEDALNDTGSWTYCNYLASNQNGVGFPRDCGPTKKIDCQWNSHTKRMCNGGSYNPYSHGFYVDAQEVQ